jgi:D-alanine-D-alanine ligase
VKPLDEGSSVGVVIVGPGTNGWAGAILEGGPADQAVMVERFIAGRELTVGVRGDEALDVIDVVTDNRFYDYDAKYAPGGSKHVLPAKLSSNIYQSIRMLALRAHQALGCRGVSRADFRYDDRLEGTDGLICLEVNTQPGMTATSLVPEMAAYAGMDFRALVRWMVEDASCNR